VQATITPSNRVTATPIGALWNALCTVGSKEPDAEEGISAASPRFARSWLWPDPADSEIDSTFATPQLQMHVQVFSSSDI